MTQILMVLLWAAGCGSDSEPADPIVEAPSTEEGSETVEAAAAEGAQEQPAAAEGAEAEPEAAEAEGTETEPAEPAGPSNPEATVRGDGDRGLTFAGVYRLAAAIGLPQPTLHGRPTEVGEGKYVVLASFSELDELDPGMDVGNLRPEIWLITTDDEGQISREGSLPINHAPLTTYEWLSVGEVRERATELFHVRAASADDFDNDGAKEFAFVVEVDDEVVCGAGLLTHRFYLVYNTEPSLSLAADVALAEASGSGEYTRATTRFLDHNDDGHGDIHLRTKSCAEGSYWEGETCEREVTVNTYYIWDEATDVWNLESGSNAPCGEDEE